MHTIRIVLVITFFITCHTYALEDTITNDTSFPYSLKLDHNTHIFIQGVHISSLDIDFNYDSKCLTVNGFKYEPQRSPGHIIPNKEYRFPPYTKRQYENSPHYQHLISSGLNDNAAIRDCKLLEQAVIDSLYSHISRICTHSDIIAIDALEKYAHDILNHDSLINVIADIHCSDSGYSIDFFSKSSIFRIDCPAKQSTSKDDPEDVLLSLADNLVSFASSHPPEAALLILSRGGDCVIYRGDEYVGKILDQINSSRLHNEYVDGPVREGYMRDFLSAESINSKGGE